jgi:hypothetical protein
VTEYWPVQVTLQLTVCQPVCLGVEPPSGTHAQILILISSSDCYCVSRHVASSLTKGRICHVAWSLWAPYIFTYYCAQIIQVIICNLLCTVHMASVLPGLFSRLYIVSTYPTYQLVLTKCHTATCISFPHVSDIFKLLRKSGRCGNISWSSVSRRKKLLVHHWQITSEKAHTCFANTQLTSISVYFRCKSISYHKTNKTTNITLRSQKFSFAFAVSETG